MRHYAHTDDSGMPDRWHPLDEHLLGVACLAHRFAAEWNAGDLGYLAGLWHDLGSLVSASSSATMFRSFAPPTAAARQQHPTEPEQTMMKPG